MILSNGVELTENFEIEFYETGCLFQWVDYEYDYIGNPIKISAELFDKDMEEINREYDLAIQKKVIADSLAREEKRKVEDRKIYEKEVAELKRLKEKYEQRIDCIISN